MSDELTVDDTTLAQRVVLLGVARLTREGAVPAHSGDIVETCTAVVDESVDIAGHLTEADVSRALNRLEDGGLVSKVRVDDTSPVGKGRPQYELGVDVETVLDAYAADDRVASLVERIRAA